MVALPSNLPSNIQADLATVFEQLSHLEHGKLIRQVLETILRMMGREADRLDWKILNAALLDMEQGFQVFTPYRHTRKITIFGSARTGAISPDYQLAEKFAKQITELGFMVMTGAGGGIMEAGNAGAGAEQSFGLNIQLPFEQGANPVMEGDPKLINFKYFFTRKLFFLRESDALVLFPGGFGTQDEAFESLTLIQTGKADPMPIVMVDHPGGNYWQGWDSYIREHLLSRGLISPDDPSLYTITDNVDDACHAISSFYRVYHSCRYTSDRLVIRLKSDLPEGAVDLLNQEFGDILAKGTIEKSAALPEEQKDETIALPRLVMHFNNRDFGRLHQLIWRLNDLSDHRPEAQHPEQK
ncbi:MULTISPECIES: TIGR00730 family Rossman fold protein [Cyanophyceae]|uniref:LOG family protein n=1 Tax=Cyanophyceae TaxID=3028117 RepID=UPI001682B559|nr:MULTISPECIES: TIGR00730 family Rossman fold protein [Cyanophyceae]MBD1918691.1 TIGR00730 family Rossman fold protein [Phormidium sp. FACHB-77]MBD2029102.1 TIGR00730 family Rossman fold protein [Phormidium sp. FACHB-322]MBD2051310.1 TIGR00730 family Rossman fold protein [Leptolyngbya sp. FACHB-60]